MRITLHSVIALGSVVGVATTAMACSPVTFMTFFDFRSAALSPQAAITIKQAAKMVEYKFTPDLPAACERIVVIGHSDTAESATPDNRVDIARAEAVRDALVKEGVPVERIETRGAMGTGLLVPTSPNVREPQNRYVGIWRERGKGQLRCDPASKRPEDEPVGPCGAASYKRCYWELDDGTICNFDDVPNPNPKDYSLIADNR